MNDFANIPELIYVPPNYYGCLPYRNLAKGHPPDPLQREYLSSQEILLTGKFANIIEGSYQIFAQLNKRVSFAGYLANFLHPQLFRQGFYLPEENFTWLKVDYAFYTAIIKVNKFTYCSTVFCIFSIFLLKITTN
jgi:hypothetical protein